MNLPEQIAKHFREVHFGGNWTTSNLKQQLADVDWIVASTKITNVNTIATLVYHTGYYVQALLRVLQNGPLDAKDELSFDHSSIRTQSDWELYMAQLWNDAELVATLIEKLPAHKFDEDFTDPKYGNYYRNIHGIIEHLHYHLGQIAIIKKLISNKSGKNQVV